MGDSQIQRINPEYFKCRTFNFGSSGEHYYFTYSKLRKLLSAKTCNIKIIVLGVSVHNFAPVYQRMVDLNCKEGKSSLERYFYFINFFDDETFNLKNSITQKDFLKGLTRKPDWSGFLESINKNPEKKDIERVLNIHYKVDTKIDFSKQETYLEKIIRLCKKKNIKILALSTPIHQYYKSHIPEIYFKNFNDIMNKNPELKHLNFLNVNIPSDYMSDGNHLNKDGAKIYSKLISAEVEKLLK